MTEHQNPAARLHRTLSKALIMSPSETVDKVWATVFGVLPKDRSAILRSLVLLLDQLAETERQLKRIEGLDYLLFTNGFSDIRHVLTTMNFDTQWQPYQKILSNAVILGLPFCADKLSEFHEEESIETAELNKLKGLFEEISAELLEGAIEEPLRSILFDLTEAMRRAIVEYEIRGAAGLSEIVDQAFGNIMRNHKLFEAARDAPVVKKWGRSLGTFARILGYALTFKEVGATVHKFIGYGGGG